MRISTRSSRTHNGTRRLLLFCKTTLNDYVGWEPEDVTDQTTHEYGIYLLGR